MKKSYSYLMFYQPKEKKALVTKNFIECMGDTLLIHPRNIILKNCAINSLDQTQEEDEYSKKGYIQVNGMIGDEVYCLGEHTEKQFIKKLFEINDWEK
jgi:hypothetical protein